MSQRSLPQETQAARLVFYYARQGFWRHVAQTAKREHARQPDPIWLFWQSVVVGFENTYNEALTELSSMRPRDCPLPCAVALAWFHQQCEIVDRDEVRAQQVAAQQAMSASGGDRQKAVAIMFLLIVKDFSTARDVVSSLDAGAANDPEMLSLRGWLEVLDPGSAGGQLALQYFEQAINATPGLLELEALMGKLKVYVEQKAWHEATTTIDNVIVNHPWYQPVLVEKAKVVMMTADMEQSMETAQRVLEKDASNIDALRVQALYVLTREARQVDALDVVRRLADSIRMLEPKNHALFYEASRLVARIAAKNEAVLGVTMELVSHACALSPNTAKYFTEKGYQLQLAGRLPEACEAFHQASTKDETDVSALYGIIHARILEGNLEEAEEQLEFLSEIQVSMGKTADLAYLGSLIAWRRRRDAEGAITQLNEALAQHIQTFKSQAAGFDFFVDLKADLMLDIAKQYLEYAQETPGSGQEAEKTRKPLLLRGVKVLETLTRFVPSLLPAQVLLAKSKLQLQDVDGALRILKQCLAMDPPSDVYLLLARIAYERENTEEAYTYLEKGLANDFKVRQHPLFHLVRAQVHLSHGETEAAAKVLEATMKLPGIRTVGVQGKAPQSSMLPLTLADRAQIFTMLIRSYAKLGRYDDATKTMQDATAEFAGTPEEVTVLVVNADLAIQKGEVDQALSMLKAMPPSSPYYAAAKRAMADIYLKHRKDKRAFARCYKDIVDHQPTSENYLILGDALLNIHEPSDAIQVFQEALKNTHEPDPAILSKIGKTYAQTHDYKQAIQYYLDTIKQLEQGSQHYIQMRKDLAELYVKLGRMNDAVFEIESALSCVAGSDQAADLKRRIDLYIFLAEVLRESGEEGEENLVRSATCLREARELQADLHKRFVESDADLASLRLQVADLSYELGAHYEQRQPNVEQATTYYMEALNSYEAHEKSSLALSRICLRKKDSEQCERHLMRLLRADPQNEEASMMMAELMMVLAAEGKRSEGGTQEYKDAMYYYQNLLDKAPCNWHALSRMVFLLRRAGRLQDYKKCLAAAQRACPRWEKEAGFRFCRGLFYRYTNKPQEALVELSFARHRDPDYRAEAVQHMIEVYLNADNSADVESLDAPAEGGEHLREVDALVKELASKAHGNNDLQLRIRVYECQALMFTRNKAKAEQALNILGNIFERGNKNFVPALLATAQAQVITKQITKARNQLKRITDIAKKFYTSEWSDEFERAWLLLADIYIQSGKFDLASQFCHLAKDHNRSCGKAWELLGLIYEREQSYKDAAQNYEKAWELCNQANPAVGYRLGFNYLKAKRYVEAINVCNAVLEKSPDYPKLRKDVLEKAWQSLRC